jgi:transposase InsO family protein
MNIGGMDMTKIMITDYGWMYLHVVKDWYTKEIVGFSFSRSSTTLDWLRALNMAVNKRFFRGILHSDKNHLSLVTDNGSQPTSVKFMQECSCLNIKQIFTTWNNSKGNADTERVMRTIKEDLVWTHDWKSPFDFEAALVKWMEDYNEDFPHQSLNNKTPCQFFNQFQENLTLLNVA